MTIETTLRRPVNRPASATPLSRSQAFVTARSGRAQWRWLAGGLVLAFSVPFVFADLLAVPRDGYYAIYAVTVVTFLALWIRRTAQPLAVILRRRWRLSIALGFALAAVMAAIVLRDPSTAHPHGWTFTGEILWRGLVYGAIDGLFLSSFPILATFAAFSAKPLRRRSKKAVAAIGMLALAISIAFTAVYHLGYPDFRGAKLKKPVAGDLIWSVPTLATLNPVGAPLAHIGLHVAAVTHSYETPTFLPPHR
jgi:hypothetical protein